MQDPETIQDDDIKIKDKQSNSENYKEKTIKNLKKNLRKVITKVRVMNLIHKEKEMMTILKIKTISLMVRIHFIQERKSITLVHIITILK